MSRLFVLLLATLTLTILAEAQPYIPEGVVTLESRRKDDKAGTDNYVRATFSFEKGINGDDGKLLTRNDWDIKFSTLRRNDGTIVKDYFDVTMVTDDRSRLLDLGKLDWTEVFEIPELKAFEKPTREKSFDAIVGHIYLVRTVDTDSDFYALFRLDELKSGETATISWKRIQPPAEPKP